MVSGWKVVTAVTQMANLECHLVNAFIQNPFKVYPSIELLMGGYGWSLQVQ